MWSLCQDLQGHCELTIGIKGIGASKRALSPFSEGYGQGVLPYPLEHTPLEKNEPGETGTVDDR